MEKYEELLKIKGDTLFEIKDRTSAFCLAPDMGGRIFASVGGVSVHRIDLENAASPDRAFNNFGGCNLWPAPEGGRFGFNYRGNEWYVQEGINNQVFRIVTKNNTSALIQKRVELVNRAGTFVDVMMKRRVSIGSMPEVLKCFNISAGLTYITEDSFEVLNSVTINSALIACWTLEQFDASEDTVSFCLTKNPGEAINFDFYEHPGNRIGYYKNGFIYKTDGRKKGQIGIKKNAEPSAIGFFDIERKLVCIRQNLSSDKEGLYFNIADNDQVKGPFSAEDTYSIFNSDADTSFFELETVGCADVEQERLLGSNLVSLTSFAIFDNKKELKNWLREVLMGGIS